MRPVIFILFLLTAVFFLFSYFHHENGKSLSKIIFNVTYFLQLDGNDPPLHFPAHIYTLDLFVTPASTIRTLHRQDKKVFCYLNTGTYEPYRPDAKDFPSLTLGNTLPMWPDEQYLDIRRMDLLTHIMKKRMELCRQKGFDGIEPDNLDAYEANSGFPLTYSDQLRYNRMIAALAHEHGLVVGLKNAPGLVRELVNHFDFAITEECSIYNECDAFIPFIQNSKAVFQIEYTDTNVDWKKICAEAKTRGFTAILKKRALDSWQKIAYSVI